MTLETINRKAYTAARFWAIGSALPSHEDLGELTESEIREWVRGWNSGVAARAFR